MQYKGCKQKTSFWEYSVIFHRAKLPHVGDIPYFFQAFSSNCKPLILFRLCTLGLGIAFCVAFVFLKKRFSMTPRRKNVIKWYSMPWSLVVGRTELKEVFAWSNHIKSNYLYFFFCDICFVTEINCSYEFIVKRQAC